MSGNLAAAREVLGEGLLLHKTADFSSETMSCLVDCCMLPYIACFKDFCCILNHRAQLCRICSGISSVLLALTVIYPQCA